MKPKHSLRNLVFAASALFTVTYAQAATFYWDGNTATPGFGTAGGTWTSQSVTSGAGRWVTSATGEVAGSATQTTTNADTFNYGTATDGLATGTITIGGTSGTPINVGSIAFGSASGAITLNGGFLAFGASKFITVNNATNTISSVIQGSNGFTKNGTGTLILTGNLAHTGTTVIANGGTLVLSGNNSSMSGTVSLSTAGTGAAAPKLNINSATAIGTGTLSFGGGAATDTVQIDNTSAGAITLSTNNALTLNRNFTFVGTQSLNLGTGAATLGGLTAGTNRVITTTANTLTIGGNIGEAASNLAITKSGAGTLVLGGANTFSGTTTINTNGGTLRITNAGALGSGAVSILTAGTNTGTLELALTGTNNIANAITTSSASTLTTAGANAHILNTSGTNTISGNITTTGTGGSGTNIVSNGGLLTLSGTITHTVTGSGRTLSLGGSGDGVVSGAINDNTIDSQILAVQKSGAGTWTFSNSANGYTGATTIAGGTLKFGNNNVIANASAVTLGGTATSGTLDIAGFSDTIGTSAVATMLTLGVNTTTVGGLQNQVINSGGSAVLSVDGGIAYNAGAVGFNNGKALISANLQMGVTSGVDRTFTVNDSSATAVDLEITGVVSSGTNGIGKSGAGTLFLNNDANTFTGQFLMNAGTTQVTKLADAGSTSSIGTGSDNSLIRLSDVSNATLEYVGSTDSSTNRRFLLGTNSGASTNSTILNNGVGKLTFSSSGFNNTTTSVIARTLTLGGSNTLDNTISGTIIDNVGVGGTVGVTKQGAGKWILSGANTHSGATRVDGGDLVLGNNLALQNSALVTTGAGNVTLGTGITTPTIGGLSGATGDLATVISSGYGNVTALTLNPGAGSSVTYGGQIADGATGMTLTKTGLGTQVLSGTNTYTGATTVSAGTLFVTGSLTSNISVSDTATVGGGGTVGDISFGGGSFFDIALAVGANDSLTSGAISFAAAGFGVDNLVFNGASVNWGTVADGTYTLLTGTLNSLNLDNFGLANAYDLGGGRSAYFQSGSLQLVVIPEPSTALLGALGALMLLRRRR